MSGISLGAGAVSFVLFYLGLMVVIGIVARKARKSETLGDFYLAGRALGPLVLLLTLYATQYSGNTIVGYPAEAYRMGYAWMMSVSFMMTIVVVYLLFAPRLYRLAKRHDFVTPGDFLDHRFGSPALSLTANTLLVIAIGNYLLAQLMAMGHVVSGITANAVPYWVGVVVLVVVIIIYETLGGLRAVAWTDCVQGLMLLVGLGGLLYAVAPTPSDWHALTEWLRANAPETTAVPDRGIQLRWLSTIVLIGFSASIYPQAIQRIYSAKSARVLKRSLRVLVFMPLVTTTVVVLVGLVGIQRFSSLEGVGADQLMPLLLHEWSQESVFSYAMAVLVVTGTLAAIMSTADSVLLSLSSMLAKDFLGKTVMKEASEERLTAVGKRISWVVMAVLALIALTPRITLWGLIELKAEFLAQASPAIILGVLWPGLKAKPVLIGLAVGATLAAVGTFVGYSLGLTAWCVNLLLSVGLSLLWSEAPVSARSRSTA